MTVRGNTFEGGTDGANVTVASSGQTGDAFEAVSGHLTYSAAAAIHGSMGMLATLSANSTSEGTWAQSFGSPAQWWAHDYFKLVAAAAATIRLMQVNGSSTARWGVALDNAGHIGIRNLGVGSWAALSTSMLATGTKHRWELNAAYDGTTWTLTLDLYLGANAEGDTPDESLTASLTLGGGDTYQWGALASSVLTWAGVQHDDIEMSTEGHIGRVTGGGPPVIATTALPDGIQGASYDQTVEVSGGVPPYDFSVTAGGLPGGLSINAATGEITGSPSSGSPANSLVPSSGAWLGAYTGSLDAVGSQVTAFEALTGRKMAVITQYHDWSPGQTWPTAAEKALCAPGSGRRLLIHQEPRVFSTNKWASAADVVAGKYDAMITDTASQLAAWGQPCWYAFAAEMDGTPEANFFTSPAQFVSAWQHIHGLFQAAGASNVQFVWCATGSNTSKDQALYPGDAYVDWLGWDPYTWGFDSFQLPAVKWAIYWTWLQTQTWLDTTKPKMLCETGIDLSTWTTSPQDGATWWAGAPAGQAAASVQAVVLFDRASGTNAEWLIDNNPDVVAAFATAAADPAFTPSESFTIQVEDSAGQASTVQLTIRVAPDSVAVSTTTLPAGNQGVAYSQPLAAAGGVLPFTWAVTSGSLPAGLNLDAATGVISGTPASSGTSSFTVTVTDALGLTDAQALSITIGAPAPTTYLSWDGALAGVRIDLSAIRAEAGADGTATIWRSLDQAHWVIARGGDSVKVTASSLQLEDFEFTSGVVNYYRATGMPGGTYTDSITPVIDGPWLKSVASPYLNLPVKISDAGDLTRASRSATFDVVDAQKPIAITGARAARAFDLTIQTVTDDQTFALEALLAAGDVLLLQVPPDYTMPIGGYYSGGDATETRNGINDQIRWTTIPLTETEAPAADVIPVTVTWASIVAAYASWHALRTAQATWLDVLSLTGQPGDVITA